MAEVSYCNYRSHTLRDLASTENRSSSTVRTWNKAKRHAGAIVDWLFSLDIQTYVQIAWPWAWCSKPIDSPKRNWSAHAPTITFAFNLYFRPPPWTLGEHTGLLNMSLLQAAATPVGILAIFSRHAGTPLTVKGSGIGTAEVSVTPAISTSSGAGGLMAIARSVREARGSEVERIGRSRVRRTMKCRNQRTTAVK